MNFIELKKTLPGSWLVNDKLLDITRIRFVKKIRQKNKAYSSLYIYIGHNIAEKIGIKEGSYINFFYTEENPRIWLIKKSSNGKGYKVGHRPGARSLIVQLTWKLFIPTEKELSTREVKSDLYEGGLRIYADDL